LYYYQVTLIAYDTLNALDKQLIENPGDYVLDTHTIVGLCLVCGFIFMAIIEKISQMFKQPKRLCIS